MSHEFDIDQPIIHLELDDGSSIECIVVGIFPAGDYDYIALEPADEEAEGEVFVYRYSEDEEGNPILENIESDEEYELVSEAFDELLDEMEFDELGLEDMYEDELEEMDE